MADKGNDGDDGVRYLGCVFTACAYAAACRNTKTGAVVSVACLITVPGRGSMSQDDFHAIGDRRALEKLRDPELAHKLAGDDWVVISRHVEFNTFHPAGE